MSLSSPSPSPSPSASSAQQLIVRDAVPSDLAYTARKHEALLPHGLFPRLGQPFLRRWHATFLDSSHGIAVVAEQIGDTGAVSVGFLLGSTDQVRLVDDVLARHRWRLVLAGGAALLRRPRLALHFVRTRAKPYLRRLSGASCRAGVQVDAATTVPTAVEEAEATPIAVITAVAVDDNCRSTGAGSALVAMFVARAADSGISEAQLTTLTGSGGAGPFYEKLGWQFVESHPTRDGLAMSTYRLTLGSHAAPDPEQTGIGRGDR